MKPSRKSAIILFLACASTLGVSRVSAQTPPAIGAPAEHLTLEGVENFARIGQTLYRGAQPKSFAYNELKNIGVAIVVDFREEKSEIASEKREVEGTGMQFVSLPWTASHGPVSEEITSFLNLVRANPDKKIFVHCRRGADRTGLMVAVYRINFDHWTPAQAVEEMHTFHYRSFLLPNLERFVSAYSPAPETAQNSEGSQGHTSH
jgi:tyrosine-protein phosphatase SIW14